MGAITGGESTFVCDQRQCRVETGSLVFVNPNRVHACNPIKGRPWAYLMLYIDTNWLADLRYRLGLSPTQEWQDLAPDVLHAPEVFAAFVALAGCLLDPECSIETKSDRLVVFLSDLMPRLSAREAGRPIPAALCALADYLDQHCAEEVSLELLCRQAEISPGHLIRCFKQHFRMTPHAYVINRRIQLGQRALRRGRPIAEVAFESGFADQPHFQRMFKRLLATTPGQYRRGSVEE